VSEPKAAPPCAIVIFGGVGDLTKRLLVPSIYHLASAGLLDPGARIIGADHNDRDAASWRSELSDAFKEFSSAKGSTAAGTFDEHAWSEFAERLAYIKIDFTSDSDYDVLAKSLDGVGNALFYLAVSPRFFAPIAQGLGRVGLLKEGANVFRRLLVEKPFGRDIASARELNRLLRSLAAEPQIYRVDHFLGKEAVQGIPALRFGSGMFEPLLDRTTIASVQISAAETVGVEERGAFYETMGALRDMVPNHLFSLLTLIAMDRPESFEADVVRDAKMKLLDAVRPLAPSDAVRGQYASGVLDGKAVPGYRNEDRVARDSRTETYVALDVRIDNERWHDVPFYIRTGKRLGAHVTTIALVLRSPVGPFEVAATVPHLLVFGIDPQRGILERFPAKSPGVEFRLGRAHAGFRYEAIFEEPPNIGYEALLYDAMRGHPLLYQRADMVEREWQIVAPVLDAWADASAEPENYPAGSAGPSGADALLSRNGDRWLDIAPLDDVD
jgi:glucose-6-phosphate 1-dehydrogenase